MKSHGNDGGGVTFVLTEGDSIDAVPQSHSDIVTQTIREAFSDPRTYFHAIAERTSLPKLGDYLRRFVDGGRWMLVLADTYMMDREAIGAFQWLHPDQHSSLIAPGSCDAPHQGFAPLYADINFVHWDSIGYSGGILSGRRHTPLVDYNRESTNPQFAPESTSVFGNSSCGDMLVYNSQCQAGYLSHENGASYVLGTIPEALDWVFGELCKNQTPEFDYSRC